MLYLLRSLLFHMVLVKFVTFASASSAHVWVTHEVEPGDNWCDVVQYAAANGDVVRLAPGDYEGDCLILKSGIPDEGEPLAVVGRGDGPVRIIGKAGAPAITVFGNYVRLGKLHFIAADGQPAVVVRGRSVLVDDCVFDGGSVGLDLDGATGGFSVIGNLFEDTATPITSTCADAVCDKTRAVLRDNVFRSAISRTGAAVTIRARAEVTITDNVVEGAWVKGFDVGCLDGPLSMQQNVVLGGSFGVVVQAGGGPVLLANNVIVGTFSNGLSVRDIGPGKALVSVVANTVIPTQGLAMVADGAIDRHANAVGGPAEATAPDDVFCTDGDRCWEDPAGLDFRPLAEGPLMGVGPPASVAGRDLCGNTRRNANAAGAIVALDQVDRRLQPVSKRNSNCFESNFIDPRLESRPNPNPPRIEPPVAWGCGGGDTPWQSMVSFLFVFLTIRARRCTR